ncbi:hypothetical protein ILYODFUR_034136 [Ilyodon furcidens]|uniref:Uncharacterized protein n=1 Tax=Ilyodon furcidens TaxID=33524 RepID=A0ABV0V8F6_9TELE
MDTRQVTPQASRKCRKSSLLAELLVSLRDTAKSQNKTDCYVCSVMPVHSQGPTIYVKAMNDSQAYCPTSFRKLGYASRQYFIIPGQFPQESHTLNYTYNPHNCTCDSEFWNALNITEEDKVPPFNAHLNGIKHAQCYNKSKGNNSIYLGTSTNCKTTFQTTDLFHNGTYWVQGVAWLCGNNAYFVLPPSWYGICALVFTSDHTTVITREALMISPSSRRQKRSLKLKPHDSVWGTNVPDKFKHWSTNDKVILSTSSLDRGR